MDDAYLETWNLIPPNEPRNYLFAFVGRIVRHLAIDRLKAAGAQKKISKSTQSTWVMMPKSPTEPSIFRIPFGATPKQAANYPAVTRNM